MDEAQSLAALVLRHRAAFEAWHTARSNSGATSPEAAQALGSLLSAQSALLTALQASARGLV